MSKKTEIIKILVIGPADSARSHLTNAMCSSATPTYKNEYSIKLINTSFDGATIRIYEAGENTTTMVGAYYNQVDTIIACDTNQVDDMQGYHIIKVDETATNAKPLLQTIVNHHRKCVFIEAYDEDYNKNHFFKNPLSHGWTVTDDFNEILRYAAKHPNTRTARLISELYPNLELPEVAKHSFCKPLW